MKQEELMNRRLFLKNGVILAASAILIRSLGMTFRIMLSERIGAEGLGLYQLVMSVYLVFASLVTSGICLCTTRMFGELSATGKPDQARYCVEKYLLLAFFSGVAAAGILSGMADFTADCWLGDIRTAMPLKLLAPSLPLMAVSACIRGYFAARRRTLPTSIEQLLEQIIEIGAFVLLFRLFQPEDIGQACNLAVIGTTAAELISLCYALLYYRRDIRKLTAGRTKMNHLTRKTLPILLPVCANALTRSGLSAAENALVPFGLRQCGQSSAASLAAFGTVSGMAMPVLVFPSVFVLPLAALIIPEMAEANARHHSNSVRHMTERTFGLTLLYSIPVTVLMIFDGMPLCRILYGNSEAGYYLTVLAPVIPLMYLDTVVDAILKGLNQQTSYFIFNTIDSVIRVILTLILLPLFGINGYLMVIIISELLNTLLSIGRLIKVTSFRIRIREQILRPLLCILTPCLLLRLIPFCSDETLSTIGKITLAAFVYTALLFLTRPRKLPEVSTKSNPPHNSPQNAVSRLFRNHWNNPSS